MGIGSGEGWPEKLWEQLTANWGRYRTQRGAGTRLCWGQLSTPLSREGLKWTGSHREGEGTGKGKGKKTKGKQSENLIQSISFIFPTCWQSTGKDTELNKMWKVPVQGTALHQLGLVAQQEICLSPEGRGGCDAAGAELEQHCRGRELQLAFCCL